MATSFGPSALMTPANVVTTGRLLMAPFLLALVLGGGSSWPAVALWIVLSGTDGLDGYIARRQGTTRSGAFLDPLADKFLVLAAMVALVVKHAFWWAPVSIIAVREAVVSGYRSWVGRHGVTVPARRLAKLKTVVQDLAVGFALFPPTAPHPWVYNTLLWWAVLLTVVSGAQYLLDGRTASGTQAVP